MYVGTWIVQSECHIVTAYTEDGLWSQKASVTGVDFECMELLTD